MKFSLKTLAAAVALAAAAGSASAAINDGSTGNGELFFSAWDGATSYTFDTNMTIDAFEASKNAAGNLDLVWGADFTSSYGSWLASANTSSLQWSVLAMDSYSQRRILATVGAASLPATNSLNDVLRNSVTDTQKYLAKVNIAMSAGSDNWLVTTSPTADTYAGKIGDKVFGKFTFDTTGSFANNSYANGVVFEKTLAAATGIAAGTNTAYIDEGVAVRAWVDSNNTLHIAAVQAVPEPSEYAMLLVGLGLMGVVACRRSQKQA